MSGGRPPGRQAPSVPGSAGPGTADHGPPTYVPYCICNALIKHVIDSTKMHLELLSVQFNVYSYSGFITFCELDIDIITYFHIGKF